MFRVRSIYEFGTRIRRIERIRDGRTELIAFDFMALRTFSVGWDRIANLKAYDLALVNRREAENAENKAGSFLISSASIWYDPASPTMRACVNARSRRGRRPHLPRKSSARRSRFIASSDGDYSSLSMSIFSRTNFERVTCM